MRGSYRLHTIFELAPLVALFVQGRVARWRGAASVPETEPSYDNHALRTRRAPIAGREPAAYATTSSVVIQA